MLIRRLSSVVVACTCISSQANAQDFDRDCGSKPGDAPAQEALTERAALAGDLMEMLEELEQDASYALMQEISVGTFQTQCDAFAWAGWRFRAD